MADELDTATEAANEAVEEATEETKEAVAEAAEETKAEITEAADETEAAVDDYTEITAESTGAEAEDADAEDEADVVEQEEIAEEAAVPSRFIGDITFNPPTPSPAMGLALTFASLVVFVMGMDTFYQIATAWTFLAWGLLFMFVAILKIYQRYEAREDGLSIKNPVRFWSFNKFWEWSDISRIDVLTGRRDNNLDEMDLHIYREVAGELVKEREDVKFNPDMAQVIIERAGLKPVEDSNPVNLELIPRAQNAKYHWTKSGSIAA